MPEVNVEVHVSQTKTGKELKVVELYVVMHCEACAASVKKAIKKIPGVESYKIDFYGQKVTVVGNVDRVDVWRRIHKTGRSVTLIASPAPPPKKEPEKKEEDTTKKEEITETKVEETTTETVKVEEEKIEETTVVDTKQELKVHEVKEEVVTVVEVTEEGEVKKEETKPNEEVNKKKEPKKPKPEPEWVPMFVSAPYYTLPSTFYN